MGPELEGELAVVAAEEADRGEVAIAAHLRHRPSESDPDTGMWASELDRKYVRLAAAEALAVRVVLDDGPCAGESVDVARSAYARLARGA